MIWFLFLWIIIGSGVIQTINVVERVFSFVGYAIISYLIYRLINSKEKTDAKKEGIMFFSVPAIYLVGMIFSHTLFGDVTAGSFVIWVFIAGVVAYPKAFSEDSEEGNSLEWLYYPVFPFVPIFIFLLNKFNKISN